MLFGNMERYGERSYKPLDIFTPPLACFKISTGKADTFSGSAGNSLMALHRL
jgi:hypothetical protein